jgi:hypothetical protein
VQDKILVGTESVHTKEQRMRDANARRLFTQPVRVEPLELRQLLSVVTYDLKSQWSDTKNPNGAWTYREGNNALPHVAAWEQAHGSFTGSQSGWARSTDGTNRLPFWLKSSATPNFAHDWQVGDILVHTTDSTNGVGNGPANVIWTSPAVGKITISGGVWMGRDIGRADHWSLLKNGSTVLTEGAIASGDAFSRANPFKFSAGSKGAAAVTNISVAKGDVIQLRLNVNKTGDSGDFVGVNLTIAETVNPTITGTVFNDVTGNGTRDSGDNGVANVKVFVDANHSGSFDTGELNAVTNSSGVYTIANVPLGAASLLEVLPSGFRATTARPVALTVGPSTSTANFGISQTVVISGNVFNDANGNKIKDSGEAGQSGVVVYLDLNNNGVLDFLDAKTTTDSSGNYKFVVPFGTYTIREVVPSASVQTTPVKALTLGPGTLSNANNIGNKHS